MNTESEAVITAYESRIEELEADKLRYAEIAETAMKPRMPKDTVIELPLGVLSNPCAIWENGDLEHKKVIQKLVFPHGVKWQRKEGYRTPRKAHVYKVLDDLTKDNSLVVRMEGLEPPRVAPPEPKSGASTNFATSAVWKAPIALICDHLKP